MNKTLSRFLALVFFCCAGIAKTAFACDYSNSCIEFSSVICTRELVDGNKDVAKWHLEGAVYSREYDTLHLLTGADISLSWNHGLRGLNCINGGAHPSTSLYFGMCPLGDPFDFAMTKVLFKTDYYTPLSQKYDIYAWVDGPADSRLGLPAGTRYQLTLTSDQCSVPAKQINSELIDPSSGLLDNGIIPANVEALRKGGRGVKGVAADGVATVLVRIKAENAGDCFNLDLSANSNDPNQDGALGALGSTPNQPTALVCAEATTDSGPVAVALYRAPLDFAWNDEQKAMKSRSVNLNIKQTNGTASEATKIDVVRPVVIFVHGLGSNKSRWDDYTPVVGDERWVSIGLDYSEVNQENINVASKVVAEKSVWIIKAFAKKYNVAAYMADFVGLSYGGMMIRNLPAWVPSKIKVPHSSGIIHKAILIGAPLLGTPLASEILSPENAYFANIVKALSTRKISSDGPVGDLVGDGFGGGLSDAVVAMHKAPSFPMIKIASQLKQDQVSGLNLKLFAIFYTLCSKPPFVMTMQIMCPLAYKLSSQSGWNTVMQQPHDGAVPLKSALDDFSNGGVKENQIVIGDGVYSEGYLHSEGTRAIVGGPGPAFGHGEGEDAKMVLKYLNTAVTENTFGE